jgi:hypothetical protein
MKIAFLMLALSIAAAGQKATPSPTPAPPTCGLTLAQAPQWDTIKLGMTEEEFKKVFPRMPFMVDRVELPDTPAFANVDNMMFVFYQERLEELTIQFDLSTHWDNIRQFSDNLSETFKLPKAWTFTLGTGMLECQEFRMRAVSSRNELKLRDTAAARKMEAENAPAPAPEKTKNITIGPTTPRPTPRPTPHP